MKITATAIAPFHSERHRGGEGTTSFRTCISPDNPDVTRRPGEKDVISWVGLVELAPGASIKEHLHDRDEEVYIVVSGAGIYTEDGEETPVANGDALILRRGHSHGMQNPGESPLIFYAVVALAPCPA